MKIHGAKISQGESEFRGKTFQYHNVLFYGTEEQDPAKGVGLSSETEKITYTRFCEIAGLQQVTLKDLNKYVGKSLAFGYDKYGKVNTFSELLQVT
jgi:hypothetical protein